MGICSSVDAASAVTAKLVLPDGRLQEFSQPIRATYVLQRLKSPAFFICNSDEMDFNDVVSALGDDEELQLGQLYFLLPLSLLRRPLKAAEMAELAVMASAALMKSCGGSGAWLSNENVGRRERSQSLNSGSGGDGRRRRRAAEDGGRRRRRTFSSDLSAIPE
uniref:Uncharacterized protein n=1 Tax=Kalanchoe fedtschenkoi TaxID=63787 RepID=A0A7N0UMG1_KALFE